MTTTAGTKPHSIFLAGRRTFLGRAGLTLSGAACK